MTLQERWRVISQCDAPSEISRLLTLPRLDRKLELVCSPPTVVVNDINWIFIDVLNEPEGFGGRFAATLSDNDGGLLLEATKIYEIWKWGVFRKGTMLKARGENYELFEALEQCSTTAIEIRGHSQEFSAATEHTLN